MDIPFCRKTMKIQTDIKCKKRYTIKEIHTYTFGGTFTVYVFIM